MDSEDRLVIGRYPVDRPPSELRDAEQPGTEVQFHAFGFRPS